MDCCASDETISDIEGDTQAAPLQSQVESLRLELPDKKANCYLEALTLDRVNAIDNDCFSERYYKFLMGAFGNNAAEFFEEAKLACFRNLINLKFPEFSTIKTEYAIVSTMEADNNKTVGLISVNGGAPHNLADHSICTVVFEKYCNKGYATHARKIAAAYYKKLQSGIDASNKNSIKAYTKSLKTGDLDIQISPLHEYYYSADSKEGYDLIITPSRKIQENLVVSRPLFPITSFFEDSMLTLDDLPNGTIRYYDFKIWEVYEKSLRYIFPESFIPYYTVTCELSPIYAFGKFIARNEPEKRLAPLKKIVNNWLKRNVSSMEQFFSEIDENANAPS
jgi:hypothetical protein